MKSFTKSGRLLTGTSGGDLKVWKWDYFGDCRDRILGHGTFGIECIESLENATAYEDTKSAPNSED